MLLTYRGAVYEAQDSMIETTDSGLGGKFRGVMWRLRWPVKLPAQPSYQLTYRGATYNTNPKVAVGVVPAVAPATPAEVPAKVNAASAIANATGDLARNLMLQHHRMVKNRQQAMLSRSAAEVGLPVDAASHWDRIQGKIHPDFWAAYDRSHVSLS